MTTSLVEFSDFALRAPDAAALGGEDRTNAILEDVSALVRLEAGEAALLRWGESPPPVVTTIVVAVARRALLNPDAATSETLGEAAHAYLGRDPGVYLTMEERRLLVRAALRPALWTLPTTHIDEGDVGVETPGVLVGGLPAATQHGLNWESIGKGD